VPDELQVIVDSLAARLQRAVDVEDRRFRVLAYSRHEHEMDAVRVASILQREAPPDVRRYLDSTELARTTSPLRVRAPAGLAMTERVCIPIHWQERPLGYLWLIDGDGTLTDEDLVIASAAAEAAGVVLYREQSLGQLSRRQERRLLEQLLGADGHQRAEACARLREREVLVEPAHVAAIAVRLSDPAGAALPQAIRVALASALERLRRDTMPRHAAWVLQPDHGVLLATLPRGADPAEPLRALAVRLAAHVESMLAAAPGWQAHIGVGDPVDALADAHASHAQALAAARVAFEVGQEDDRIALWRELGAYQLLSAVPAARIACLEDLPPGLVALLRAPGGHGLAATLEAYLDNGGDIKTTATELHLHRSSLYYRLHKAETLTGTDLHSGMDRLLLHLALKLARLAGHYPEPAAHGLREAS
jgi:PucR C-terminal helix-turn-helix domain/GGDEF-like domain